ncbi:membrane-bound lytic murein transglycosylase D [Dysgonomonadaceae bacterium PH5-43]|nr:membrane-bound lytic murein transglycosylase D [Dysgonomonadaceae bacterium PH5-43]
MKKHFILFLLLTLCFNLFSQTPTTEEYIVYAEPSDVWPNDSVPDIYKEIDFDDDLFTAPEYFDVSIDSLLNSWHIKYFLEKKEHSGYNETVAATDAVYMNRLERLNNIVDLPYNNIVRNCINLYVDRRRSSVEYMLGLENYYFPMIEQALDENGLPDELKYLAIVESALNPVALSRVGASGLWQFMLPTAKQYGLEINSLVDERRDPLKATYAACEYFKDMYKIFGDWTLCIAAYNCGAGNVNKAIKRAKGSKDYWTIYPYLPKETRMYVPLFIAATYVMNYYAHHQLYPAQSTGFTSYATDTVMVESTIHFNQLSEKLDIDIDLLRALNPQYKMDLVPGQSKPRPIRLPAIKTYAFIEKQDSIINHEQVEQIANKTYTGDTAPTKEKITYKVVKGDSLYTIANRYGVTAKEIRKWNGLKSSRIGVGKKLTIYINNGGYSSKS